MAIISMPPFGRGAVSNITAHIDAIYDELRNAELDWRNLHPQAGIHESFIAWHNGSGAHWHLDGSLGNFVLTQRHIDKTDGSTNAEVLFTSSPKTLILFGHKDITFGDLGNDDPIYIDFISTSEAQQAFAPGTEPLVFFMLRRTATEITGTTYPFKLHLVDVSSQWFAIDGTFLVDPTDDLDYGLPDEPEDGDKGDIVGEIFYLAVGVAPGLIDWPED